MFDAPQANQLQTIFTIGAPPPPPTSHTSTSSAHASTGSAAGGAGGGAGGSALRAGESASPPEPPHAPAGLSPSAYGGIGAGAALVALLIVGAAVLLCRRRKKKAERQRATTLASPYLPRSSPGSEAGLRECEEKEALERGAPAASHETSPVELSSVAGSQRKGSRSEPAADRVGTAEGAQFSRLRHELPADNEVPRPATAVPLGAGAEIPASLRAPARPVTRGG
jgi:hypothetical protein